VTIEGNAFGDVTRVREIGSMVALYRYLAAESVLQQRMHFPVPGQ
jgi:hypothetical protein